MEEITAEVVLDCCVSSWISRFGLGEREDTVCRDRLKPHRAVADPVPAALRGPGRPRARLMLTHVVFLTNVPGGLL